MRVRFVDSGKVLVMVKDHGVTLDAASNPLELVKGTSPNSRYVFIASGKVNIGIRCPVLPGTLSVRAVAPAWASNGGKPNWPKGARDALKNVGLQVPENQKDSDQRHLSMHVQVASVQDVDCVIGSILFAARKWLDRAVLPEDTKHLIGKGIA